MIKILVLFMDSITNKLNFLTFKATLEFIVYFPWHQTGREVYVEAMSLHCYTTIYLGIEVIVR